jgi:hypothetical protein
MLYIIGYLRLGGPNRLTGGGGRRVTGGGPWPPPVCMLKKALSLRSGEVMQREHENTHYASYTCSVLKARPNRNLLTFLQF